MRKEKLPKLLWKNTKRKREILKEGQLQLLVEDLVKKYPTQFIDALVADMADDKNFFKVLNELNIASEFEFDEENFDVDVDDDGDDDIIETRTLADARVGYEEDV